MADFRIKRGDVRPVLEFQLTDDDGTAIDLTGASVQFLMKRGSNAPKVNKAATITTATEGRGQYAWVTSDTDEVGEYDGEFEVTHSDGDLETFPSDGYLSVVVEQDLGDAP